MMKTRTAVSWVASIALALAADLAAETPRGSAVADVGGRKVTIDYGRPSLKGRDLDVLLKELPPDRMWRAGENQVTTLTTSGDVTVAGRMVPAGKYSVYVHAPQGGEWSLVLNKDLGIALGKIWDQAPDNLKDEPWPHMGDYEKTVADLEVVRAKMTPAKPASPAELFTISFRPKGDAAELTLAWGDRAWSVDVAPAR